MPDSYVGRYIKVAYYITARCSPVFYGGRAKQCVMVKAVVRILRFLFHLAGIESIAARFPSKQK